MYWLHVYHRRTLLKIRPCRQHVPFRRTFHQTVRLRLSFWLHQSSWPVSQQEWLLQSFHWQSFQPFQVPRLSCSGNVQSQILICQDLHKNRTAVRGFQVLPLMLPEADVLHCDSCMNRLSLRHLQKVLLYRLSLTCPLSSHRHVQSCRPLT